MNFSYFLLIKRFLCFLPKPKDTKEALAKLAVMGHQNQQTDHDAAHQEKGEKEGILNHFWVVLQVHVPTHDDEELDEGHDSQRANQYGVTDTPLFSKLKNSPLTVGDDAQYHKEDEVKGDSTTMAIVLFLHH